MNRAGLWRNLARSLVTMALLGACSGQATQPEGVIDSAELAERIGAGTAPLILDVRSDDEYAAGHIAGAQHIPYDVLATRLDELDASSGAEIVVYCHSGRRAGIAGDVLRSHGFTGVRDLEGHWQDWSQQVRSVVKAR